MFHRGNRFSIGHGVLCAGRNRRARGGGGVGRYDRYFYLRARTCREITLSDKSLRAIKRVHRAESIYRASAFRFAGRERKKQKENEKKEKTKKNTFDRYGRNFERAKRKRGDPRSRAIDGAENLRRSHRESIFLEALDVRAAATVEEKCSRNVPWIDSCEPPRRARLAQTITIPGAFLVTRLLLGECVSTET